METLQVETLVADLALILMLGAIATVLFKAIKQPVILGYIVAGFVASPHFSFFPTVSSEANIEFWAQIGIVVLLFSLGLEFSFKKLLSVGGSAVTTAAIIVLGMMGLGFAVGKLLGFEAVDAIFLGGMLSMSSTTIIIKALSDLNLRHRRFVPLVLAVLVVEDMFAVVLMVVLSSVAINQSVSGSDMVVSVVKLVFFLVMWFTVGVFMLPSLFRRFRAVLSDEIMLVISMGLCFMMAVFSVWAGFSMALGAFVMGSILAGTVEAERIERIVTPVKDLFGAVFFISVGMMVNPEVIAQYAGTIALLSAVVVVGMILFGTFGMLATGQPLQIAVESGFCLTQIGEFSFIIATTGMSLGVLQSSMYPIIVAVSVVTTFFTPYFIKSALPAYNAVARVLPQRLNVLLEGYSSHAAGSESSESRQLWGKVTRRWLLRLLLYSVVAAALVAALHLWLQPFIGTLVNGVLGSVVTVVASVVVMSPFLYAIVHPGIKPHERAQLLELSGKASWVPLVVMQIVSFVLALVFAMAALWGVMLSHVAVLTALLVGIVCMVVCWPLLGKHIAHIEQRFVRNVNVRENRRTGKGNNVVSDLHLAHMTVGYGCAFVGKTIREANLRAVYGVNVVNIQRNQVVYPVPSSQMHIFPGDVLGVIGNDEQIQALLPQVEAPGQLPNAEQHEAKFQHFALGEHSPIVGKKLREARLREDYASLLVSVQRAHSDEHITPTPDMTFAVGDVLWIVGDSKQLAPLKR